MHDALAPRISLLKDAEAFCPPMGGGGDGWRSGHVLMEGREEANAGQRNAANEIKLDSTRPSMVTNMSKLRLVAKLLYFSL